MNGPIVYLAGPITDLSYKGCTEWREHAKRVLSVAGIKGVSPMRAKDYLAHLDKISGTGEEYAHLGAMSLPQGVMTRDHFDATRCDAILVNLLGAKAVSVGTVMEIAFAYTRQIPIICAIEEKGNPHNHMMLTEAIRPFRVADLDEALHIVKAMLA